MIFNKNLDKNKQDEETINQKKEDDEMEEKEKEKNDAQGGIEEFMSRLRAKKVKLVHVTHFRSPKN